MLAGYNRFCPAAVPGHNISSSSKGCMNGTAAPALTDELTVEGGRAASAANGKRLSDRDEFAASLKQSSKKRRSSSVSYVSDS
jgi:hypothetical protein